MNAMQRIRLAVFAILLASVSPLPAHSQSATASIEGIVLDSSGAVLPGVTVTAVHRDTGASRSTVSDEGGLFRLPLLPVGTYEVTAELGGFSTRKQTLVRGWSLSAILTAQTGQPYSARVGAVDLNGDGNTRNDYAPGTTRNAFRLPSIVTFDPRIARDINLGRQRVQLIWEAFNLFNRDNINGVDQTYYSVVGTTLTRGSTFGRPLSSAGERIMQLAVKLTF